MSCASKALWRLSGNMFRLTKWGRCSRNTSVIFPSDRNLTKPYGQKRNCLTKDVKSGVGTTEAGFACLTSPEQLASRLREAGMLVICTFLETSVFKQWGKEMAFYKVCFIHSSFAVSQWSLLFDIIYSSL